MPITYKPIAGAPNIAVYVDRRRVGTIHRIALNRFTYCPGNAKPGDGNGPLFDTIAAVKRDLEG